MTLDTHLLCLVLVDTLKSVSPLKLNKNGFFNVHWNVFNSYRLPFKLVHPHRRRVCKIPRPMLSWQIIHCTSIFPNRTIPGCWSLKGQRVVSLFFRHIFNSLSCRNKAIHSFVHSSKPMWRLVVVPCIPTIIKWPWMICVFVFNEMLWCVCFSQNIDRGESHRERHRLPHDITICWTRPVSRQWIWKIKWLLLMRHQ